MGLQQDCPLSPFLFTIVMEFFSAVLTTCANSMLVSTPFRKRDFSVSHLLFFADDVIIFSQSTPLVARNLKAFLDNFYKFSGLSISWQKSTIFFSNCEKSDMGAISTILGVEAGQLPVKYLGMPLSSKRLSLSNCQPLLDKFKKRLSGWKSKILSYAGRVELIRSTISTLHLFWATVLPKSVLHAMDKSIRNFFWNDWSTR